MAGIISKLPLIVVFFICLNFATDALAHETIESNNYEEIFKKVQSLGNKYGIDNIAVVYDIDNTLLALNQDLGSDQWGDWQMSMLKNDKTNPDLVAQSYDELFRIQQKIFSLSATHKTVDDVSKIISNLEEQGYFQVALSSRGILNRDSTVKELLKNQIIFQSKSDNPDLTKTYFPYSLKNPESNCLSENEISKYNLKQSKLISYGRGILLTEGQHKGVMLKTFLCNLNKKFKAVVFIDDKEKNVSDVNSVMQSEVAELVSYRFSGEDSRVKKFHDSDKSKVKSEWLLMKSLLNTVFGYNY